MSGRRSPTAPFRQVVEFTWSSSSCSVETRGRNEPDRDNLIKASIDALDGVLGVRTGTGLRVEADDVRVDRITASKRHAGANEDPGARITVAELCLGDASLKAAPGTLSEAAPGEVGPMQANPCVDDPRWAMRAHDQPT